MHLKVWKRFASWGLVGVGDAEARMARYETMVAAYETLSATVAGRLGVWIGERPPARAASARAPHRAARVASRRWVANAPHKRTVTDPSARPRLATAARPAASVAPARYSPLSLGRDGKWVAAFEAYDKAWAELNAVSSSIAERLRVREMPTEADWLRAQEARSNVVAKLRAVRQAVTARCGELDFLAHGQSLSRRMGHAARR
jgi:hypothetical protein